MLNKLLRIDLNPQKISVESIPSSLLRKFMGGKGLAAHYLYQENQPNCDPLSPNAHIAFMNGPLTGAPVTNCVNFAVCAKSPLTGTWNDSHCNGWWGPELRFAGYLCIIVSGRSDTPMYVNIVDDQVEILPADNLWGKDTFSTQKILKERHSTDREARVLSIGPAAERMAKLACVFAEYRTAARGGLGAVMGSKRLKAIVVTGHKRFKPANPDAFKAARKRIYDKVKTSSGAKTLRKMGTSQLVDPVNETGGLSNLNYTAGRDDNLSEKLNGPSFMEKLWDGGNRRRSCRGCAIQCSHLAVIKDGKYKGLVHDGPEFESITLLGSNCGINDPAVVTQAEHLCDSYGIDSMSTGSTISFLMECFSRGLITSKDTGGLELTFGNADALIETIHMMGASKGPLAFASDGNRDAAEKIGNNSEDFAMNVKGLEIPAYLPQAARGQALAYAVSDRGACHIRPWMYGKEAFGTGNPLECEGKGAKVWEGQMQNAILDSIGVCKFLLMAAAGMDDLFDLYIAATGFNMEREEFDLIGKRLAVLTRAFNNREGFNRTHDTLPKRVMTEGRSIRQADLDLMLDEYYESSGFTKKGIVPISLLRDLEIS
ncbi:MAG TPA: aldehyde ferredoxin oxidoreductase family protein [Candidatus Nanoarchaeia archaeon]|nr:aldehyde ferredoxin oxidoreductase family protein [Candidatus Nanoarchaeia archaeon]